MIGVYALIVTKKKKKRRLGQFINANIFTLMDVGQLENLFTTSGALHQQCPMILPLNNIIPRVTIY